MKYLYGTAVMAAVLAGAQAEEDTLVSTALQLMAKASSTSEVLTLNLTNLLILLVLKAIIVGFGLFSVGGTARSAEEPTVTETDLHGGMCFLMFTSGSIDKLECIQKAACNDLNAADQYTMAGKMWFKMYKMLGVEFPDEYRKVINAVDDAKSHAKRGGDCNIYKW